MENVINVRGTIRKMQKGEKFCVPATKKSSQNVRWDASTVAQEMTDGRRYSCHWDKETRCTIVTRTA